MWMLGTSSEEVKGLGVRVGDPIIPTFPFTVLGTGKTYLGKAFDDRIGCALFIEVVKNLIKEEHPNVVYGVGTARKKSGCGEPGRVRGSSSRMWA